MQRQIEERRVTDSKDTLKKHRGSYYFIATYLKLYNTYTHMQNGCMSICIIYIYS